MKITRRNDFGKLLKSLGLTGSAIEIGVAEGFFSHHLLDTWPGICYQVDPWMILDTPGFSPHGEATNPEQEARYQRIIDRSKRYHGRCLVMRATSEQAVSEFRNYFFDFIYIDAIHTYEAAQQDISMWYPKLKSGGILAGHDYLDGIFHGQEYGVKRAVTEFASAHGLTVNVIAEEWPSYWAMKP